VPEVRVYTTPFCGYCTQAKRMLARKNVAYKEIDVSGDYTMRRWLAQASGQRTVPQIFIGERACGGFTDLVALDQRGELDALLGAAPAS
jgi:glutaredoxin 3